VKAPTQILLYSLAVTAAWLLGIAVGAHWERESIGLANAGVLQERCK
jgi:hypothetical protein